MKSLDAIVKSVRTIIEDKIEIASLKGVEKASILLGLLATFFVVTAIVFLFLIFTTFALANFLNVFFESTYLGYLIIAALYLLMLLVLLMILVNRKNPFFTDVFVKKLVEVLNISSNENK